MAKAIKADISKSKLNGTRAVAKPGAVRTGAPASSTHDTVWARKRVKANLSRVALAQRAGLGLHAVTAIEAGKREASKDEARALRAAFSS